MTRRPSALLALSALALLAAGCGGDGTGPDTNGTAQVTIVTASGTQSYTLDARFYPYSPGPSEHQRAVYFTVGTGRVTPGLEFQFYQDLPADQELPVTGTFVAEIGAGGTHMATSAYFTGHPELGHAIGQGSTTTLQTVSATRVTGSFDLNLDDAHGVRMATVHATFNAPRAATFQDLPQLAPGDRN